MNKEEMQNKINELEKQLNDLKEELNKPENKVFKPKIGDIYYSIKEYGEIIQYTWNDDKIDNMCYIIGNCFETKEEAEFEVEKLKVIAELKRFTEEHNELIDWNAVKQEKWYLCFDMDFKQIDCRCYFIIKRNDIYFSSKELAQQAVKEIGAGRIKKYYLGVEE